MWKNSFSLSDNGQNVSKSQSGFVERHRKLCRCRKMFGTLEHNLSDVRGCVSSEADLYFLTTCCSTCFSAAWILPRFDSLYVMHLSSIPPSPRKSKLVQRRRYTCPSAQDISRALQNPGSAPSASAVSLDELIQRCLNCFGQSLCCTCSQSLSCAFALYHNQVI